jgi:hypothetical protein
MSFQPVVPFGGYSGWRFLQRTLETQQTTYQKSEPITRSTDYFRENISNVNTASDLVNDRRLLEVALGAFGLDDDINNKFFIQKILEDGTFDDSALANRLADNRYAAFSSAFGFGDFGSPLTKISTVAENIITKFHDRQFETAVGEKNNDLRLALNFAPGVSDIVADTQNKNAQWFSVMGNQPLRQVVQTALGLPSQIASIDIDQQLQTFQSRAQSVFGTDSVSDFSDPVLQEKIVRLFLIRSEATSSASTSGGSIALTLLQSSRF